MDLATSSKYDLNIARSWISLFFFWVSQFVFSHDCHEGCIGWGHSHQRSKAFPLTSSGVENSTRKNWKKCRSGTYMFIYTISPKVTHVFLCQLV